MPKLQNLGKEERNFENIVGMINKLLTENEYTGRLIFNIIVFNGLVWVYNYVNIDVTYIK